MNHDVELRVNAEWLTRQRTPFNREGTRGKPVFAAFDLLWLDGEDLRDLQLWQRKSLVPAATS